MVQTAAAGSKVKRALLRSVAVALTVVMLISIAATLNDYLINPSGIFHNENGPNWDMLMETFTSWAGPLLVWLVPLFFACTLAYIWLRETWRKKN